MLARITAVLAVVLLLLTNAATTDAAAAPFDVLARTLNKKPYAGDKIYSATLGMAPLSRLDELAAVTGR
jgi:hypothetical protein